ncbi:MAG: hypothetical protein V6Z81_08285 [Parvularculales bacterium]
MRTLTALSIALVMAFAFSAPVVLTATPADAGDRWHCWGAITGYSQCDDEAASNGLLDSMPFSLVTPAHAGDWLDECIADVCYNSDGSTVNRGEVGW